MIKHFKGLKIALLVVLMAALVLTVGCGDQSKQESEEKAGSENKETWKIGMNLALTGPIAAIDENIYEGAKVAVDNINKAGGVNGRLLELVVEDNQSDPTTAVTVARKIAQNKDIIATSGPSLTTFVLPTMPIYSENKVMNIGMGSGMGIIQPVNEWIFKFIMSDYKVGSRLVKFLAEEKKVKKVAILFQDDTSGNSATEDLKKRIADSGMEVAAVDKFAASSTDMRPQLLRINKSGAEAIIVWGSPEPASVIAKNIKEIGMKQIIAGSHGIAGTHFLTVAGSAAEGWYFYAVAAVAYKNLPSDNPYKDKIDKLAPQLKKPFDAFHGNGYDATYLLAEAIKQAGPNATRSSVRDAFENIKDIQMTLSIYDFGDHDGQKEESLIRFTVKDGEFWPDK